LADRPYALASSLASGHSRLRSAAAPSRSEAQSSVEYPPLGLQPHRGNVGGSS
jgi:hypothetical protein